jgi:ligand-binding sensor domain-containing protein
MVVVPTPVPMIIVPATGSSWYHYWRPTGEPVQVHDLAVDGEWLWIATARGLMRVSQYTLGYEQFSHVGRSPGVPPERMTRLLVDDEGRLWVGGEDGLMRYEDDSEWTMITTIPAHNFALDAWGNLWIFRYGRHGLFGCRFQGQEQSTDNDCEPENTASIPDWDDCAAWRFLATSWLKYGSRAECIVSVNRRSTARDASGANWSIELSDPFLIRNDGETVLAIPRSRGSNRAIVAAGVQDGVWIGLDEGLFYGKGQTVREYSITEDRLVPWEANVHAFAFTGDGRVWASTSDGLFCLEDKQEEWRPVVVGGTISVGEGASIVADDEGYLWLLGDDALARFDGQVWRYWSLPETVQGCAPRSRTIGEFRGGIWVAVGACGLWRFDGETWAKSSLDAEVVTFTRGLDDMLYAVTDHGFVYVYDGVRWVDYFVREASDDLENNRPVIAVYADGSIRRAWMSGGGRVLLWRYPPEEMWDDPIRFPTDFTVASLLVDSRGDLWVGGPLGLLRCDEQVCQSLHFADDSAWRDPDVNVLAEDPHGRIWVGGQGWLSVYDPALRR